MKRIFLQGAAMLVAMSGVAFAQTAADEKPGPTSIATSPSVSATAAAKASEQQNGPGLRSQIKANLEQAGFTDVTIMADSFLVQATDRSGNAVIMFLDPDSLTVMTEGPTGKVAATAAAKTPVAAPAAADAASKPAGIFATIPVKDDLSSSVLGLSVYNGANQNIGTIKDIAFAGRRVQAYIVGVGGFLGLGDHYVAVVPSAVTLTFNAADKTWHAAMDTDAAALKAAPEYKYAS